MRWENWTKNLRELRDLGIEGIYSFAMGSYYAEEWMQPLRAYLIAKTMWDPDRDPWDAPAHIRHLCPVEDSAAWSALCPRSNTKHGYSMRDSDRREPLVCMGF